MTVPEEYRDNLRTYYLARGEAFLGEVDTDHVNQLINDLTMLTAKQSSTTLVISSPGGDTNAGFRLA
jgi:ATP-dependent protease ClpP protease subunit